MTAPEKTFQNPYSFIPMEWVLAPGGVVLPPHEPFAISYPDMIHVYPRGKSIGHKVSKHFPTYTRRPGGR